MRLRSSSSLILFLSCTILLSVLLLLPIVMVIQGGFWVEGRFTLRYLMGVFQNPIYAEGLFNSLCIAIGTTTLALFISVPLALLNQDRKSVV